MSIAGRHEQEPSLKRILAVTGILLAISLLASASASVGCSDDTANPFVFDAGTRDATSSEAGRGGSLAEGSADSSRDATPNADVGAGTDTSEAGGVDSATNEAGLDDSAASDGGANDSSADDSPE